MTFLLALLLGLVQGFAELLPVSSSGHLAILQNLLGAGQPGESYLLLNVMLHIGTLAAVCSALSKDIRSMFRETTEYIRDEARPSRMPSPVRLTLLIGIATLPLFIALPLYRHVVSLFAKTGFIGVMLIFTGVILYVTDRMMSGGTKRERTLTAADALFIGFAQLIALIPGLSRLGVTVAVARMVGAEQNFAVKFSLLMSVPAIIGSTLVALTDAFSAGIKFGSLPLYIVGMVVAAIAGLLAIRFTTRLMKRGNFAAFGYYCLGVGALVFILSVIV